MFNHSEVQFLGTARSPSALARLCPRLALSLAPLARTMPARLRKFLKITFLALNILVIIVNHLGNRIGKALTSGSTMFPLVQDTSAKKLSRIVTKVIRYSTLNL